VVVSEGFLSSVIDGPHIDVRKLIVSGLYVSGLTDHQLTLVSTLLAILTTLSFPTDQLIVSHFLDLFIASNSALRFLISSRVFNPNAFLSASEFF